MAEEIEVAGLVTKLSIDDTDLEKSMAELNRTMKLTQSEFKKASSGLTDFGKGSEGLKLKSDSLSKQLQTQGVIVAKLKQDYDKAVESGSKNADQLAKMETRLNKASTEYNNLDAELKKTNTDLEKQQKELIIANSNWTKLGSSLDAAGKKMQDAGKKMSDSGKELTKYVTAPLVAVGALATKASIDFESAFAGVRKTVDATEVEFAALEKGIRSMAKEIPVAATEIARVGEAAGQLGIQTHAILGFTRTMVDLGVATNMSSEQAATSLARLANITQMSQQDFDKLGSTVVALGNNLATTESEIVEMGLRIAGAGKTIGLTEAQILGFAGALSSVGIEAQAGGTAISKLMVNIASEVATGGKKLQGFAEVAGMTAGQFQQSFQEDAAGAVITFIEGLGKLTASGENVFGVMEDLGLTEVRLRDALLRASGAGDLLRTSIDLGSKAWQDNMALTKEAEQRYNTTASKLQILKNRMTEVGITLGDALIPALTDALKAMEPMFKAIENGARWFSELDAGTQKTIITIVALTAALGPVLFATGKILLLVGKLTTVFGAASTAVGAAGTAAAGAGAGFTAMLGPIGLAIAAVAALTVAGIALYRFFSKDAIPSVQRFGDEAQGAAQKASGSFERFRKESKTNLEQTADTAKVEGAKIGENIAKGVSAGTGKAKDTAVKDMKEMVDRMKEEVDRSTSSLNRLGDAITNSLKKQYDEMEKIQTDALDKQVEAERNASDERLKIYDKEYTEKLKLIDEEAYKQIKAIQDQIDGIDSQTEAEEKALKEQEYQARLAELQKQLAAAETAEEREKIQQDLNRTIADYERRQLLEQRKSLKEGLKDEIDVIKEKADERKEALKLELEEQKQNEKDKLEIIQDGFEDEKAALKTHFSKLKESENLQAEARKLIIEQNNDEIIRLLETYSPKWQDAGQSFADSFSKGLESEKQTIEEAVKGIVDIAPAIDSQVAELDRLQTKLEELQALSQSTGGGGGGVGIDLEPTIEQTEELTDILNQDLSPAIEGVTEASKEMEVEALKSFIGLNDKATIELNGLKWSGGKITEETAASIADTFFAMGNTITENLGTSHEDQLRTLQEFFENSSTLTEEEETEALRKLVEKQTTEEEEIQNAQNRIAEILSTALDGNGIITQEGWDEINRIQQEMNKTAERTLGEHEIAQKTILEKMKADASRASALQAAEVVKNSIVQKDGAVQAAEEQYDKVIAEIIRQRDEMGTITAEQAEALIADAKEQRDESIRYAEEMHEKVVEEAQAQARDHAKEVDWETGEIKSKWEVFKDDTLKVWDDMREGAGRKLDGQLDDVRLGFLRMKIAIGEKMGEIKTKVSEKWDDVADYFGKIDLKEIGQNIIQGLIDGLNEKWESLKTKAAEIGTSIKDSISGVLNIQSPSRVMMQLGEYTGEGMAIGLQNSLANIKRQAAAMAVAAIPGMESVSTPSMSMALSPNMATAAGNQTNTYRGGDIIIQSMQVRNDNDIHLIAKELYILQRQNARGKGQ